MRRTPPRATLFPYTTLFRSREEMMNHRNSRREFLNLTGAGIATLASGAWPGSAIAAEGQDSDLVVFNAKVYTVDPRIPRVERSEEHTSELQSHSDLVCRLLL